MVAVAVERYRLKKGKWPVTLSELVPLDPFDGKPLRYRLRGDGVTVYSVGVDGKDDGGNIDPSKPLAPGTDQGYRLWDVKHRRLPPPQPGAVKPEGDGVKP
jgi:hypothetical protein